MTAAGPAGARRPAFRIEPYVQFAQKAMAREATYRFDVFTNVASVLVRVYLLRMVWVALYARPYMERYGAWRDATSSILTRFSLFGLGVKPNSMA